MLCSFGTHFSCTTLIKIYLIALWALLGGCSVPTCSLDYVLSHKRAMECFYYENCQSKWLDFNDSWVAEDTNFLYCRCKDDTLGRLLMCTRFGWSTDFPKCIPTCSLDYVLSHKRAMECFYYENCQSKWLDFNDSWVAEDTNFLYCRCKGDTLGRLLMCTRFGWSTDFPKCTQSECNRKCDDGESIESTDLLTMVSAMLKPPPTTTLAVNERCKIPENLANVIIKDELRGTNLQVGSKVPTNTVVSFACHPGFNLVGDIRTFCQNRGWQNNLPTCIKYCNATMLQEGFSTKATCYFENVLVPCRNIRPGTSAVISCETDYQRKNVWEETTLTCTNEYKWNNPKTPCEIRCGYIQQPSTAFASNGGMVNVIQAPWHVGVYSKLNKRDFKRTCGGSIVSTRIVVSAAHCVWDEANSATYPAGLFKVAAAQLASRYIITEGSDVSYIYVPSSYSGADGNYQDDLAILKVVNIFKFTETVKPICFEPKYRAAAVVENDELGFIVGWGPTTSSNNVDVFQKIDVSSISYQSCLDRLTINDTPYDLPTDKFCVRRVGRTGDICRGDSGGGFVKNIRGRYYLVGVVSHAPLSHIDCGRDGLVALTNVQFYTKISKYIDRDKDRVVQQNVAM